MRFRIHCAAAVQAVAQPSFRRGYSVDRSICVAGASFSIDAVINSLFKKGEWQLVGGPAESKEQIFHYSQQPILSEGTAMRKAFVLASIFVSAALLSPAVYASVSDDQVTSQKIKEADGTSGQNTNSGSGVKTNHIQNGAVTDAKITGPISASKISVSVVADTQVGARRQGKVNAGGINWACSGAQCSASTMSSTVAAPLAMCQGLAREVGAIRSFTLANRPLNGNELQQCNSVIPAVAAAMPGRKTPQGAGLPPAAPPMGTPPTPPGTPSNVGPGLKRLVTVDDFAPLTSPLPAAPHRVAVAPLTPSTKPPDAGPGLMPSINADTITRGSQPLAPSLGTLPTKAPDTSSSAAPDLKRVVEPKKTQSTTPRKSTTASKQTAVAHTQKVVSNKPPKDDDRNFVVYGQVINADKKPAVSVKVVAFDVDISGEDKLGTALVDAHGHYSISYTAAQFKRSAAEQGGPELLVRVYDENDQQIGQSRQVNNAARMTELNVEVNAAQY